MTEKPIPNFTLPHGAVIPTLGQGTWMMGETPAMANLEIASLERGIDLGMTLIDTAEMYADGGAERIVAEAIKGRRDAVFLVSKLYPWNASRHGALDACARSLDRMGVETIDLYLLHWRGEHPLEETVAAFEQLKSEGRIGAWGVSNFDADDMAELFDIPGGDQCAANQILYNLARRGPEFDVIPYCRTRGVAIMAYSPIEQGKLARHPDLIRIAKAHQATPAQVALAFLLVQDGVIAIPKTANPERAEENRSTLSLSLTENDLAALNAAFPPPRRKTPLEMI